MAVVLDTCYFIDLQRKPAVLETVHEEIGNRRLAVTPITLGEFAEGVPRISASELRQMFAGYQLLELNEETAWHYGQIRGHLRASGQMIGANDLWIAAIALANDLPVVTRNADEFGRVPGLAVIRY